VGVAGRQTAAGRLSSLVVLKINRLKFLNLKKNKNIKRKKEQI
jgi:hypothetical protein